MLATEDHKSNKPIRAGLFYYDTDETSLSPSARITIEQFTNLAKLSHSSLVPMACNKYLIYRDGTNNYKGGTIATGNFKNDMLYYVKNSLPENNTILIQNTAITDSSKRQLFNRYNISRPYYIKQYNQDIGSEISNYNANTKFIFMPYMTWLSKMVNENVVVYNGKIPDYSSSPAGTITSEITSLQKHINPAAGIPVLYENRSNIWNSHEISACASIPSSNNYDCIGNKLKRFGTVQLELTYPDSPTTYRVENVAEDHVINTFEYFLRSAITVNEVNHTHTGYTWTRISVVGSGDKDIETNYSWRGSEGNIDGPYSLVSNNNITSYYYTGLNSYINNNAETSCYIKDSTGDMMRMLFGNRFKFNDFYKDYNPLAMNDIKRQDIASYFTPGGSNDYVQGNTTQVIAWITEISNSMPPPEFTVNHRYYQTTGEKEGSKNLLQGNFFFSGNHSNRLNAQFGSTNKDCTYRFVPQPDPITATTVNIIPSGTNFGHFTMEGNCNHFWNNVAEVDINLKHGTNTTEIVLKSAEEFPSFYGIQRPYKEVNPPNSTGSYLVRDGTNIVAGKIEFDSVNNTFKIKIEVDLTPEELTALGITDPLSGNVSCTMRFINENGGFRDVCKSKSNSLKTSGYFKINDVVITPTPIDSNT